MESKSWRESGCSNLSTTATVVLFVLIMCCTTSCTRIYEITLSGIVRDAISGEGIEGVAIRVDDSLSDEDNVVTDRNGAFVIRLRIFESEFAGTIPKWTLNASKPGYAPGKCEIDLSVAQTDPKSVDSIVAVMYMLPKVSRQDFK